LIVAWQGASQGIAATVAALVGFGLSAVMAPAALDAYGWRIAFLLGAVTLPFGFWIRRRLPETLHAAEGAAMRSEARTGLGLAKENSRVIVLALIVLAAGTIGTYVFNYMATFAQHTLRMSPAAALFGNAAGSLASVVAVLYGGWLSDRIGRRPVMIWPKLVHLVLILPVYFWIVQARSPIALVVGSTILGFVGNLSGGPFYAAVTESLPKRIRGGAFALIYALSITFFGGTTQLVITWLIHITGSPMAPAFYVFGAWTIGFVAMMLMVESAPAKTPPLAAVPAPA
jgi:MFS family permease